MIIKYHYRVPLDGKPETVARMRAKADAMTRYVPEIRGMDARIDGGDAVLVLRMSGLDRWRIAAHQRKLVANIVGMCGLDPRRIVVEKVLPEPSRRDLTVEQGRTPMVRRPRSERRPAAKAG